MADHTFAITVYKESPYLEACIQSLLAQTVKSKIIIATSTPTAFTQNIASAYNIPYHINITDDKGPANNWNFALLKADTQWVTVAHQDDIYISIFAEICFSRMNKNGQDVSIVFTNYTDVVSGVPRKFSVNALVKNVLLAPFFFISRIKNKTIKKGILAFGNPICCPSVTFNKALIGDFQFREEYKCVLDWYAWYELAKSEGSFLYVNKKLVNRRLHTGSGTTELINNGEKKRDELRMFEMMWGRGFARLISRVYGLSYKDNLL
ncbi:MAG: glycosyltransferase [Mucilaginibacter sp.]|uniref:glycosyltransferase n=1 Tax=Mucilaginibacter sp. TaxID=1882438 RepID=UPI00326753F5